MALASIRGGNFIPIGPGFHPSLTAPSISNTTIDATNEALILVGQIVTSDGASHTLDTSGSSSIGWRTGSVTFSNGGTTVKVGVAAVDTANGPPARAAHSTDVITFDVNASFTGGGGGITANAWQTSVPTTGTKTIANGDLVAVCIQMTARGGADLITPVSNLATTGPHRPTVTTFTGGSYAVAASTPNFIITFADGAFGYFHGTEVFSSQNQRTWNSGSGQAEYGQLYNLPFPCKIFGLFGWFNPSADCNVVLYSDPLGTPVAEKTISLDANVMGSGSFRRFSVMFASPYSYSANQNIGAIYKPGGSSVTAAYKTLDNANHRIVDPWGTSGYGISRASGSFANANSSLDHYYIGLIASHFESGVWPSYGMGI